MSESDFPQQELISESDPYLASKKLHQLEQVLLFQAQKFVRLLKDGRGYGQWKAQLNSMQDTLRKLQLEAAPPEDELPANSNPSSRNRSGRIE